MSVFGLFARNRYAAQMPPGKGSAILVELFYWPNSNLYIFWAQTPRWYRHLANQGHFHLYIW